jgi:hypothetical protein
MDDLDRMFARLRAEPPPGALGALEEGVMAGLVTGRERLAGRKAMGLACGVAAVVGLWGGLSGSAAGNGHEQALLDLPAAAPSQLLAS